MTPLIENADGTGFSKSDRSGNGGNCLEVKLLEK
jgi:hypothetical protein